MTFDAKETSLTDGQPVELYEFQYGTTFFRYTSSQLEREINTFKWKPTPLDRENLAQTSEVMKSSLQVTVPADNEVAALFKVQPPSEVVTVRVFQYHETDNLTIVVFVGRVLNASWQDERVTMSCDPAYAALQRQGLRRCYQLLCPHALYSASCGALIENFKLTGTVVSVTGTTVEASVFGDRPDGWLNGGFLDFSNGLRGTERRAILSHVGTTIKLQVSLPQLVVGSTISVYAGCAHNMDDCGGKFNNLLNYGGMPYIPQLNPYTGDPVF
jgi:uncharacterized phage protein (TIGR02218 family)